MKYIKTPWLAIAVVDEGMYTTIKVHRLNEEERKGGEPFFCDECDTNIVLLQTEVNTLIDMLSSVKHPPTEAGKTTVESTIGASNDE